MSDARDVMRETLMNARQCRKACYEIRSCDCAQDVVKILAALAEAGLVIVPREPTELMLQAGVVASEKQRVSGIYRAMVGAANEQ
jgi:hypothetical protein